MLGGVNKVLFICAHTDDEMVCAGTLRRLARLGAEVVVVASSIAATRKDRRGGNESICTVLPEWHKSMETIGVDHANRVFLGITPSIDLHAKRQEVADVAFRICEEWKPDLAVTLSPDDENPAHAVVGIESERVMRGRVPVVMRCHFPYNYSLGRLNVCVELAAEDWDAKRRVIECYQSQMPEPGYRYDYTMFLDHAVADGKAVKRGPVERFELLRAVI